VKPVTLRILRPGGPEPLPPGWETSAASRNVAPETRSGGELELGRGRGGSALTPFGGFDAASQDARVSHASFCARQPPTLATDSRSPPEIRAGRRGRLGAHPRRPDQRRRQPRAGGKDRSIAAPSVSQRLSELARSASDASGIRLNQAVRDERQVSRSRRQGPSPKNRDARVMHVAFVPK
jgi:hypothetical protein